MPRVASLQLVKEKVCKFQGWKNTPGLFLAPPPPPQHEDKEALYCNVFIALLEQVDQTVPSWGR